MICRSGNADIYIDFGAEEDFYGVFYICLDRSDSEMSCAESMFKFLNPPQVNPSVEAVADLNAQIETLTNELKFFRDALRVGVEHHSESVITNEVNNGQEELQFASSGGPGLQI